MEITWYGHSCFRFADRGMATVVTDPFDHLRCRVRTSKTESRYRHCLT